MPPIDAETRLCAVIGNPVAHSLSPVIHNAAFQTLGLNYVYLAFRVEDVGACLAGMRALEGFRGLSVTIPHKIEVMKHLDEIDPLARRIGSVNTVTNENGRLIGETTDGPGTLRAFAEARVDLKGKRVLLIGAGGAVRAVAFALARSGAVARVTILGRTPERVKALAQDLEAGANTAIRSGRLPDDLPGAAAEHDVLINGTPVGMYPESEGESVVPRRCLRPDHVVFDMVYRPARTRLLEDAAAAGCTIIPGIEMLLYQAALQFERWTGRPAPIEVMRRAALDALGQT